jgi:hypothetical protein
MKSSSLLHRLGVLTVVISTLFAWSDQAQAICAVTEARYTGGTYGAQAVASPGGCFRTPVGGTASTSVQDSSAELSASADLSTGVITAWSSGGMSSAAMWDTVHFSGLSDAGADVVERLSLVGHISGNARGWVSLGASLDPSSPFNGNWTNPFFGSSDPFPSTVDLHFTAHNGDAFLVFVGLTADAWGAGVADLSDPPTLSFVLPQGASFTSDSGVLLNNAPPAGNHALPEPSTLLLAAASLLALTRQRSRR